MVFREIDLPDRRKSNEILTPGGDGICEAHGQYDSIAQSVSLGYFLTDLAFQIIQVYPATVRKTTPGTMIYHRSK
jgi:hypothetical protein